MKRRGLYCLLVLLTLAESAFASDYCIPISGVRISRSASFAELRPGHFHGGIDFRTFGQTGKPVLASADGYVWKITLSPSGYGLGLYVRHPKLNTMTVYGHLSRLEKHLQSTLDSLRTLRRENICEYTFAPSRFSVKQGSVIAYSGNTGSSFGPHLHFEIRTMDGSRWLNPISLGLIKFNDNVPPRIRRIHAFKVDSLHGVARLREQVSLPVLKKKGKYILNKSVSLSGDVFFVIEVRDEEAGSPHHFGIHNLRLDVDGKEYFSYRMDSFSSVANRYVDAISFYPLQLKASCEVIRMAREKNIPQWVCGVLCENGLVHFAPGSKHSVRISVWDASANCSILEFEASGSKEESDDKEEFIPDGFLAGVNDLYIKEDDRTLFAPKYSLFSPAILSMERKHGSNVVLPKGVTQISDVMEFFPYTTPLGFPVSYSVKTYVPFWKWSKAICLCSNDARKWRADSGWMAGSLAYSFSQKTGFKVFVLDEQAPKITPLFRPKTKISGKVLCFSLYDNLSGVLNWNVTIDGVWQMADYSAMRCRLSVDISKITPGRHNVEITSTDHRGNISRKTFHFNK